MMIGVVLPRRRWLVAAVGMLVPLAIQLAPRDRTVSLATRQLAQLSSLRTPAVRAGGCAPFLDELVRHPGWELHVVNSGNTGPSDLGRFVIHADGGVDWSLLEEPDRRLSLTADERARVRALDRLGCTRSRPINFGERSFQLYRGDAAEGGAYVEGTSAMSKELEAILVAAMDRYDEASMALTGPLRIELDARSVWTSDRWTRRAARYHLTLLPDGTLVVKRDHRVVTREPLDRRTVVDLVDAIIAAPRSTVSEDDVARGHATVGTHTVPLRVDDGAPGGLALLSSTLDEATAE